MPRPAIPTVLRAGLVAGTLDITAALLIYPHSAAGRIKLLQGIASGLIGKVAFGGGLATAGLGLFLHFTIAMSWAAIYFAASRRIDFLVKYAIPSGMIYGIIVYLVMNRVVVPLSAIGPRPFVLSQALLAAAILIVCIGLPIALLVRHDRVPPGSGKLVSPAA
jgi:hypothetical protein